MDCECLRTTGKELQASVKRAIEKGNTLDSKVPEKGQEGGA